MSNFSGEIWQFWKSRRGGDTVVRCTEFRDGPFLIRRVFYEDLAGYPVRL